MPVPELSVATINDAEALARLKRSVEDQVYADYGSVEEHQAGLDEFCSPEFVRDMITAPGVVLRATLDNQLVGMGALGERAAISDLERRVWLQSVYCTRRRQGIGSLIVRRLLGRVADEPVHAEAYESNIAARNFLRQFDFRPVDCRRSASYASQHLVILRREPRALARDTR